MMRALIQSLAALAAEFVSHLQPSAPTALSPVLVRRSPYSGRRSNPRAFIRG